MSRPASSTIDRFLNSLPVARRHQIERVREVLIRRMPPGYEEVVSSGMLVYRVPPERYTHGPKKAPLWYVALASEKQYLSLHLMSIYADPEAKARLAGAFAALGKRPSMGKACVRFTRAEDLPLDAIGDIVAATTADRWIEVARSARTAR